MLNAFYRSTRSYQPESCSSGVFLFENYFLKICIFLFENVQVQEVAKANNLAVHMDGARMMNAAVALKVSPAEILHYVDTVSICFSKVPTKFFIVWKP